MRLRSTWLALSGTSYSVDGDPGGSAIESIPFGSGNAVAVGGTGDSVSVATAGTSVAVASGTGVMVMVAAGSNVAVAAAVDVDVALAVALGVGVFVGLGVRVGRGVEVVAAGADAVERAVSDVVGEWEVFAGALSTGAPNEVGAVAVSVGGFAD